MTQQTLTTNTTTMNRMRDGFDRLFDSMLPTFARTLGVQSTNGGPAMNIIEDDVNIYVETELPGIMLEDIELSVTNDVLTIVGSRVLSAEDDTTVFAQFGFNCRDAGYAATRIAQWQSGEGRKIMILADADGVGKACGEDVSGILKMQHCG